MIDMEKVIKGLECCSSMNGYACAECPYSSECGSGEEEYQVGTAHLAGDALALIDTQYKLILELQNLISIGTKMMNGDEVNDSI